MSQADPISDGIFDRDERTVEVAAPLAAAAADIVDRGWRLVVPTIRGEAVSRTPIVLVGSAGAIVAGTSRTPESRLNNVAAEVISLMPAPMRRTVRVVADADSQVLRTLAGEIGDDGQLTQAELAEVADSLAMLTGPRIWTTAKVLEWTRDARPEPQRNSRKQLHPSAVAAAAGWVSRHALVLIVLAVVAALLTFIGPGRMVAGSTASHTASPTTSVQHDAPVVPAPGTTAGFVTGPLDPH